MAGGRKNLELTDTMGITEIADALDKLVFTAAHGWQRSISIDRNVRDALVRRLRSVAPLPHPSIQKAVTKMHRHIRSA